MKLADEHVLDPMNSRPDVAHGEPRDLAHRLCVQILQVRQNQLPVDEFQALDQFQKPAERLLTVGCFLYVLGSGWAAISSRVTKTGSIRLLRRVTREIATLCATR